jgi:hypothetical protein
MKNNERKDYFNWNKGDVEIYDSDDIKDKINPFNDNNQKVTKDSIIQKLVFTVDRLSDIIFRRTSDGGKGSGNYGHKGRPGKIGGSGEGGVSEPELRESIVEALLAHETAGYHISKKEALEKRSISHLINSYKPVLHNGV